MADAWKMIALNWKKYLLAIWPYLLLAGVANAIFFEIALQYVCQQVLPGYLFLQSGGPAEVAKWMMLPNIGNAIYLILSFLFFAFGNFCFASKLFSVILHYKANNCMPKCLPLSITHDEYKRIVRLFYSLAFFILATLVICAPFIWLGLKWKAFVLLIIPIIGIYGSSACYHFVLKHVLYSQTFKESLVFALKHALGLSFTLLLLTSIPVFFAQSVMLMPELLYGLSRAATTVSVLTGDVPNLPILLSLLFFLLNTITNAFSIIIGSYQVWCMSLKTNKTLQ